MRWVARWERQQEAFVSHREERFDAIITAVESGVARADPVVLDLGCGPGSLAVRLLDRIPRAVVVAIDVDPLALALGRASNVDRSGLTFTARDLRDPGWADDLGLPRQVDAAVSTTTLHWLTEEQIRHTYGALSSLMGSGGLVLNGDHFSVSDVSPELAALEKVLGASAMPKTHGDNHREWDNWWDDAMREPALADVGAERARLLGSQTHQHDARSGLLSTHVAALDQAGFAEVGVLWQRGSNRILGGVRGRPT